MTQRYASPKEHIASLEQLLRQKRDDIKHIAARHGAYNSRVFGSVARGDAGPESDIDFLIDAGPATSSWFPAGLILDLEDLWAGESRSSRKRRSIPTCATTCCVKPYIYE